MKLRFATFNLFQFVEPPYSWYSKKEKFNQTQWLEKTSWIKTQIQTMNCDIIGFQEVFSNHALKELVKELGFNYFETVDVAKLCEVNKNTFISTTVAIASKYPIINIQEVPKNGISIEKHNFVGSFEFSRIPIKALIKLPNEQEILVYVCHLKSNRLNEFEYEFTSESNLEYKKNLISKALVQTDISSLKQRLCEASSLFFDIKKSKDTPCVLMCDLNDKEFSITIDALSNAKYHNEKSNDELILNDAYHQFKPDYYNPHPDKKSLKRKNTSYFMGKGNILDYIFISNDFNKDNKNRIAQVSDYKIFDNHLRKNKDDSLLKSDHAQVVCELTFI